MMTMSCVYYSRNCEAWPLVRPMQYPIQFVSNYVCIIPRNEWR